FRELIRGTVAAEHDVLRHSDPPDRGLQVELHVPGKMGSTRRNFTKFITRSKRERGRTRRKRPVSGVRQVVFMAIPYFRAVPVTSRPECSSSFAFVSACVATLSALAT